MHSGWVNDEEGEIEFILDRDLFLAERVAMHPNLNTSTLVLNRGDFLRFLENACVIKYKVLEL